MGRLVDQAWLIGLGNELALWKQTANLLFRLYRDGQLDRLGSRPLWLFRDVQNSSLGHSKLF